MNHRTGLVLLTLVVSGSASAVEPRPWPGKVRVQGPEAFGDGLRWDPALTDAAPADDRELAWEAAATLETRPSAWYQRIWGVRVVRPPRTLDAEALAADVAKVEAFFRARGWPQATATVARQPGRRDGIEDVLFVVDLGPGALEEPPDPPPTLLDAGWQVKPLVSAFGRGATLSAYTGAHADWKGPATSVVALHGEAGVRAFGDPTDDPPFDDDIGVWSDLNAEWSREVTRDLRFFTSGRGRSDLWPSLSEAEPSLATGLRWSPIDLLTAEAAARVGLWTSWAWEGQKDEYAPWFEGPPLAPGQPMFAPQYGYGRLDLTLIADTTDTRVLPRRGVRVALETTPLGLAGAAPFVRAQLDARGFVPLVGERWIAVVRSKAGGLDWHDADGRNLLGERFFLGAEDMRGWGRRRVVPPDYAGTATDLRPGGNVVTYANAELRWHVHRDLALAVFLDTGRVWEAWTDIRPEALLWDAGLSASVPSPLGSLRVDSAFRLNRQPIDGGSLLALQLWIDQPW